MSDITEIIKVHLTNIKDKIAENMAKHGRNASGKSVSSLTVEATDESGTIFGSPSFLAMQKGRGPGAVPANFRDIIKRWAIAKGISTSARAGTSQTSEQALNSFAGAVAFNIMKKGTRIYREKRFDDIISSAVDSELEAMGAEIALVAAKRIDDIDEEKE